MKTTFLLLASVILCGCSKAPVENTTPPSSPSSLTSSPAPSTSAPSSPSPAPVAEYTNSFTNELAIQIAAAREGFAYGRAQAMQLEQQAHFGSDVGSDSELGSYSFEELTNEITSNFWRLQANPASIQK